MVLFRNTNEGDEILSQLLDEHFGEGEELELETWLATPCIGIPATITIN
jgi:hypothetical protein